MPAQVMYIHCGSRNWRTRHRHVHLLAIVIVDGTKIGCGFLLPPPKRAFLLQALFCLPYPCCGCHALRSLLRCDALRSITFLLNRIPKREHLVVPLLSLCQLGRDASCPSRLSLSTLPLGFRLPSSFFDLTLCFLL